MNILKTGCHSGADTHTHWFSYLLQTTPKPRTLLQTEAWAGDYTVEGRQEMPPGLLFHLLFMILWVRNLSTAYLCSRLCQLLDWWWQVPGDPAHVSGVPVLAVGWGALVFRWPFALQMLSH